MRNCHKPDVIAGGDVPVLCDERKDLMIPALAFSINQVELPEQLRPSLYQLGLEVVPATFHDDHLVIAHLLQRLQIRNEVLSMYARRRATVAFGDIAMDKIIPRLL